MAKFSGTGVAVVTPFHIYGTIDFHSLEQIIEHVIKGGVNFILALGTTAEVATLSKDERNAIINFFVEIVNKRVPILLGIGGNNTQDVVNKIKAQSFDGIDAIMSIAPYYNKPQQKGLYYHFRTVANASPVPVFLYNDPARTSVNINADTTLKLAKDVNNIVGINESSGDLKQIMQIMSGKPPDFKILSGDDILTLPLLSLGAEGAISVVANIFPKEYSEMVKLGLNSKWKEARQKHYRLLEIIDAVFVDGNPSGIKAALDSMGLCKNNLRLPLVKVNKAVYKQLKILIEEFED